MTIYQVTRRIQARHLKQYEAEHRCAYREAITVRIDETWREVFDVWAEGDDPASMFGDNADYTKVISDALDYASACWVLVRYVVEEKSNPSEVADALYQFRTCDLVDVQVPDEVALNSREPAYCTEQ